VSIKRRKGLNHRYQNLIELQKRLSKIYYFIILSTLQLGAVRFVVHVEHKVKTTLPGQWHWTDGYYDYIESLKKKIYE
jgi:hypothetical protein